MPEAAAVLFTAAVILSAARAPVLDAGNEADWAIRIEDWVDVLEFVQPDRDFYAPLSQLIVDPKRGSRRGRNRKMIVFWKRCAVGLAAAAASVATLLVAASPAGAAAPAAGTTGIQIEAVSSATPVMVSDVAGVEPEGITATLYCAVRDNTFGCQQGTPGDGLVVSILYYNTSFGGSQVVIFNPAYQVGCSGGTGDNEGGANLGAAANQISSVRTFNSCDVKLFDGNNATGTASAWLDVAGSLGAMDNRANSFKIS